MQTEFGVLGPDLSLPVLREDMEVVPLRNLVLRENRVVDSPAETTQVFRIPPLVYIDAHALAARHSPPFVLTDEQHR